MKMRVCLALLLLWSWPLFAAVSAANKATGGTTSCSSPQSTDSFTPGANKLILVSVHSVCSSACPTDGATVPSGVTGNGLTYTEIGHVAFGPAQGSGKANMLTVYRGMGASPTAGAVQVTWSENQSRCEIVVDELSGMDTSGTNGSGAIVQSPTNSGSAAGTTGSTLDMGAFADSANATYGVASISGSNAVSAGTGFTRIGHTEAGYGSATEFAAGNVTPVSATWGTNTFSYGTMGIEIKVAGGGGGGVRRRVQVIQ